MTEDDLDPVWKALADPTRRRLLDLVKGRPRMTGDLAAEFPHLSRFAVMKHLAVLEEAGLILVRRRGRERWNHLNAVPIRALAERWIGRYEAAWAGSLLRLRDVAEEHPTEEVTGMPNAIDAGPIAVRSILIEQEVQIAAPPAKVFDVLTQGAGVWWDHSWAQGEVRLDARVGGRFEEVWSETDGALYATVTRIKQGELLAMTGPMGMTGAVQNVMEITLEASDGGTRLRLSHRALGEIDDDAEASYSGGWTHLLAGRLKSLVETGSPEGSNA
jgi:uncharacterized protein YndB with AHSA1/START domain/DNA-binding transcriptional ArsR family regulator